MKDAIIQFFNLIVDLFNRAISSLAGFVPHTGVKGILDFLWGIVSSIVKWIASNFGDVLAAISNSLAKIIIFVVNFIIDIVEAVISRIT